MQVNTLKEYSKNHVNKVRLVLLCYLEYLRIPKGYNLVLKPESSSYFGYYSPLKHSITLFLSNESYTYTIGELIDTLIHEVCHYLQDIQKVPKYKGFVHDVDFNRKRNYYIGILKKRSNFYAGYF